MESGPPLNLSTTIKVEDLQTMVPEEAPQEYTVEGEVVTEEVGAAVDEEGNTDKEEDIDQESQDEKKTGNEDTKEKITSDTGLGGTNTNDTDYKCPECQAEFVRASQLRAHERTHYEEQVRCCLSTYCSTFLSQSKIDVKIFSKVNNYNKVLSVYF